MQGRYREFLRFGVRSERIGFEIPEHFRIRNVKFPVGESREFDLTNREIQATRSCLLKREVAQCTAAVDR